MICLISRPITRPRPIDVGTDARSEYPQAGGGCSREERKEVSEDEEEEDTKRETKRERKEKKSWSLNSFINSINGLFGANDGGDDF